LIRGHLVVSKEGELTLPSMSLVDNERREIHVDLTREADVLVQWADLDQVPSNATSKNMVRGRTKIPVSRWTWRASGPKDVETFQIEKNDSQFAADTLTTIAQGPSGWTATLHSAIRVQKGVLSQVTLAVPNGFRPPYRIEPAGLGFEGEVRETVSGRQVTFLLSKPIAAREILEMQISGELDLPPNQRLEVPHLRLLGSTRNDQYLLLPTRVGQQHVEWNLIGLKSKTLPKHLSRFSSSQENGRVFFVEEPQFFAQELSYQGPLQKADLRYAFISGTLDQAGHRRVGPATGPRDALHFASSCGGTAPTIGHRRESSTARKHRRSKLANSSRASFSTPQDKNRLSNCVANDSSERPTDSA